jgi:hypothetical protein
MRSGLGISAAILAAMMAVPVTARSQAFAAAGLEGAPVAAGSPDGMVFAEGTRAINEGRWTDAVAIFSKIAEQKSDHADGALYWKAYAENKLGHGGSALDTCAALRSGYPRSSWIDECGALEIEIQAKSGQPVKPKPEQSDEVRLLVLNTQLLTDPPKAKAELEAIANDEDASPKLKDGALFLLGQQHTGVSYAQIARISYVQGDVRIARGKDNEKATGAEWEQAAADTPLESGFSLVSGNGRAEIELEDASTFYLGENSVLSFNDLETTDGVPHTEVALLAGTVSLNLQPYVPGELFILRTPTGDDVYVQYPHHSQLRVTSYTDATSITPLVNGTLRMAGGPVQTVAGQSIYLRDSHRIDPPAAVDPNAYAAWDKWVAEHVAQRTKALTEAMQAAGLATPLPGLAEMQGQGHFFDCPPYGTCWEPNGLTDDETAGNRPLAAPGTVLVAGPGAAPEALPQAQDPAAPAAPKPHGPIRFIPGPSGGTAPKTMLADLGYFPCMPTPVYLRLMRDPASGKQQWAGNPDPFSSLPYRWGVCHSGYWIHRRHHYTWVAGKRHHHAPVQWIKYGKTIAYVPIHPKDVKGQPPINGKHEVFAVKDKDGVSIERIQPGTEHPIEVMKEAPKEFRAGLVPLERAAEPHAEAHALKDAVGTRLAIAKPGTAISFDHKTQSFMMAHEEIHGGRTVSVTSPISNHAGNLQAHSGGFGGSGGSHAGGGSSGSSGGGSHGGGGGSSSSSSSGGSSGGGGGGGGHH